MSLAIHFNFPHIPNVHCLFTLRDLRQIESSNPYSGGNLSYDVGDEQTKVLANREKILQDYGALGLKRILDIKQVHGQTLIYEPQNGDLASLQGDGLASKVPGQGLLIKTADCQAILITDRLGEHILALHVGWRGNLANFIGSALQNFCATYKIKVEDLFAVRGPSLGPAMAQFTNYAKEWPEEILARFFDYEHLTMNLWALTRWQLESAGVPKEHIYGLDLCTQSNPTCFSYRREKVCGRQGGLIWMA